MRKTIIRTITMTTVESANVIFEKGVPTVTPKDPLTFNGLLSEDKALKEVRKVYGENTQVTNITTIDNVYEISVEDFIKYAKKLENPSKEEKEENNAD